jgi:hypothetical protein
MVLPSTVMLPDGLVADNAPFNGVQVAGKLVG